MKNIYFSFLDMWKKESSHEDWVVFQFETLITVTRYGLCIVDGDSRDQKGLCSSSIDIFSTQQHSKSADNVDLEQNAESWEIIALITLILIVLYFEKLVDMMNWIVCKMNFRKKNSILSIEGGEIIQEVVIGQVESIEALNDTETSNIFDEESDDFRDIMASPMPANIANLANLVQVAEEGTQEAGYYSNDELSEISEFSILSESLESHISQDLDLNVQENRLFSSNIDTTPRELDSVDSNPSEIDLFSKVSQADDESIDTIINFLDGFLQGEKDSDSKTMMQYGRRSSLELDVDTLIDSLDSGLTDIENSLEVSSGGFLITPTKSSPPYSPAIESRNLEDIMVCMKEKRRLSPQYPEGLLSKYGKKQDDKDIKLELLPDPNYGLLRKLSHKGLKVYSATQSLFPLQSHISPIQTNTAN